MKPFVQQSETKICRQAFPTSRWGRQLLYLSATKCLLKTAGKRKKDWNEKWNSEMCLQKQRSFPNIPPSWERLGLEVQHHTALRGPHNHSPRRRRNFWPATRDAFSPTGSTKAFDFKLMQWWKSFSQPPLPKQIRQKLLLPSLSSMELVCPSKRTLGLANSLPLRYEVRRGDWLKVV